MFTVRSMYIHQKEDEGEASVQEHRKVDDVDRQQAAMLDTPQKLITQHTWAGTADAGCGLGDQLFQSFVRAEDWNEKT